MSVAADPPPQDATDDATDTVYEFYAPFAHIGGQYEWCRVRSPTHGVFDLFIALGKTTAKPATVYTDSGDGQLFMMERYPESRCIRVPDGRLTIGERDGGRTVHGVLESTEGPVRAAEMTLRGDPDALPRQVPYGGDGKPVWGSERFTCWGVDLVLDATVDGFVVDAKEREKTYDGAPGVVTLGSFGRITALSAD